MPQALILHSRQDDVLPFADTGEFVANSGLPVRTPFEVGTDHRPADSESPKMKFEACDQMAMLLKNRCEK